VDLETIDLDGPELNERFVVKSNDEGLARLWLTSDIRRLILGTYDESTEFGYHVELNWENVSIRRLGLEKDEHRLEHAIKAAAALGFRGYAVMDRCRDIARSLGGTLTAPSKVWRPDASVAIRLGDLGEETTVDHISQALSGTKQALLTRVRKVRTSAASDRYLVARPMMAEGFKERLEGALEERRVSASGLSDQYWIGGEELSPLSRRLDRHRQHAILRVAPAAVVGDEDVVTIWLSGFVDDIERLRQAIELVDTLSADFGERIPTGPYR
jgi:hypothetical protein